MIVGSIVGPMVDECLCKGVDAATDMVEEAMIESLVLILLLVKRVDQQI